MPYVMKYDIGEFKNVYRPRSFDYVVGQDGVKKFFKNAFSTGIVPQAILFEGPKGTGKTTIARIVAMALNCLNNDDDRPLYEPCQLCINCKSILNLTNPDFYEVNVADKTGVNDMRALAESFKFTPMYLKNKIFILDEAHQLSKAAQNKLLKDLEDTPDNVFIIFCTTDASSLIETLVERCYTFKFSLLTEKQLNAIIDSILLVEDRELNDSVKDMIITTAEGSARKLLVNLHKVLMIGDDLSLEDTVNILGANAEIAYSVYKIMHNLLKKDFRQFCKDISKFNPKECNDLCFSLISILGSELVRAKKTRKQEISQLIDYLHPALSVVNKGFFINCAYKYITS